MVKPNMYFVSSSWNPLLSCALAAIEFKKSIAAAAAGMTKSRQAENSTDDAFGLLEDIRPAARLDAAVSQSARALLTVKKTTRMISMADLGQSSDCQKILGAYAYSWRVMSALGHWRTFR
jgi:hypothetical protein